MLTLYSVFYTLSVLFEVCSQAGRGPGHAEIDRRRRRGGEGLRGAGAAGPERGQPAARSQPDGRGGVAAVLSTDAITPGHLESALARWACEERSRCSQSHPENYSLA